MKQTGKLMRASGILLALTLMTSCFVGGTFAKYTTTKSANDNARVAKWGVEIETVAGETFATTYTNHDSGFPGKDDNPNNPDFAGIAVDSTEEVVAPGTLGSFGGDEAGITVTGEPEVGVYVTTKAFVELGTDDDWTVDGVVYCPLIFKVGNTVIDGLDYSGESYGGGSGGITNLESKIAEEIQKEYSGKYDAGASLNIKVDYEWAWLFDQDDTSKKWANEEIIAHTADYEQEDTLDTKLGDKADADGMPKIDITVTTTVEQAD